MAAGPGSNLLLAGLPRAEYDRIHDDLEPLELTLGRAVFPSFGDPDHFYFVSEGLISHLYETADGESAEIAIVGPEGGIGLPLVLGGRPFPAQAIVQAPGHAWTLRAVRLREEFERGAALRRNILRFVQALMTQMAQTVVCNRHHSVELQLCRWILLSVERLPSTELEMTQEMIAHMLGVRRAGVNEGIARLRDAGLVDHSRGQIRVIDRDGLEARACECYRVISAEYAMLREDLDTEAGDDHEASA